MSSIASVFLTILLPVFLLIGAGWGLDRGCNLDMRTLSKLNFYLLFPAIVFVKILESSLSWASAQQVVAFGVLHLALLFAAARLLCWIRPLRGHCTALTMGGMFYNAGNYGLPLSALAFPGAGAGIMACVLMVQNLTSFTVGPVLLERRNAGSGLAGWGRMGLRVLRVPMVLAILAALALRMVNAAVPDPVMTAIRYLGNGMIPLALVTLGAQLSKTRVVPRAPAALIAVCAVRAVISPLLAWGVVAALGLTGVPAKVCILAGGLPVAVTVYILASEYQQDEELASQAVFWSTLLSIVTMTALLVLVRAAPA